MSGDLERYHRQEVSTQEYMIQLRNGCGTEHKHPQFCVGLLSRILYLLTRQRLIFRKMILRAGVFYLFRNMVIMNQNNMHFGASCGFYWCNCKLAKVLWRESPLHCRIVFEFFVTEYYAILYEFNFQNFILNENLRKLTITLHK